MRYIILVVFLLTGCSSRGIIGLSSEGNIRDDGSTELKTKVEIKVSF